MSVQDYSKNPKLAKLVNFGAFLSQFEGTIKEADEHGTRINSENAAAKMDLLYTIPDEVPETEEGQEALKVQRKHNDAMIDLMTLLARSHPGMVVGGGQGGGIGLADPSVKTPKSKPGETVDLEPFVRVCTEKLPENIKKSVFLESALSWAYHKRAGEFTKAVKAALANGETPFVLAKVGGSTVVHRRVLAPAG